MLDIIKMFIRASIMYYSVQYLYVQLLDILYQYILYISTASVHSLLGRLTTCHFRQRQFCSQTTGQVLFLIDGQTNIPA